MPHIGVQRFAAGHDQEHGAEHRKAMPAVITEECDRVARIDCGQHDRLLDQPTDAQGGDHDEPEHHHRAEQAAHPVRAVLLNREHDDQNRDGDRHHVRLEQRRGYLESLDRAQDGDRRGDHAVAVEQRGAEDAHQTRASASRIRFHPLDGSRAVSARMPPSP